jgi:glyoxylate reductase
LIMTLSKRIVEADKFVREHKYKGWEPMLLLGMELKNKTLGLVGTGRIGSDVGRILNKALGMKILYNDPRQNTELENQTDARKVELGELLKNSDIVSLHVPLLDSTKHLINLNSLAMMKNSALLINTSRGPVVNEADLVIALKSKIIAGAALDVHEFEPRISEELMRMNNVILTPHIASATVEARNEMAKIAAQSIIDVLEGRNVLSVD